MMFTSRINHINYEVNEGWGEMEPMFFIRLFVQVMFGKWTF